MGAVRELRVAVTAEDYEEALRFYRDALGLPVIESWENEGGSGAVLDAGRATLEVLSRSQTDFVDQIEAGGRCGSRSRSKTQSRPPSGSRPVAPSAWAARSSRLGSTETCGCGRRTACS
jgi:catechol 2,3-dioxygenase-like lactoylglutathione lyase family enzyme